MKTPAQHKIDILITDMNMFTSDAWGVSFEYNHGERVLETVDAVNPHTPAENLFGKYHGKNLMATHIANRIVDAYVMQVSKLQCSEYTYKNAYAALWGCASLFMDDIEEQIDMYFQGETR